MEAIKPLSQKCSRLTVKPFPRTHCLAEAWMRGWGWISIHWSPVTRLLNFSEPVLFSVSRRGWCIHLAEGVLRISGIGKAPTKIAEYSTANKTVTTDGKSAYRSVTIRVPTLRFSVSILNSCPRAYITWKTCPLWCAGVLTMCKEMCFKKTCR